jgi:hypothetical protein
MGLKKRELCNLHQGNRSVAEYIDVSNNLARYAPDDVATDAARRERFLDGLSDELALQLSVVHAIDYQTLLDKARILENKQQQIEGCKRKFNHGVTHSGSHQKTRNSYEGNESSGNRYGRHNHHSHGGNGHQQHKGNGHHHNVHKGHNNHSNGDNNGNDRNKENNFVKKAISQVVCYKCNNKGHYANDCKGKKDDSNKPNPF